MKIYTKKGDEGKTSLFDSRRVFKDDIRVESYGTVDELGSYLGLCKHYVNDKEIFNILEHVQNKLFVVMTSLATERIENVMHHLKDEDIGKLEYTIDTYLSKVPKQNKFILPGSSIAAAQLHVARTICRRAERRIVSLAKEEDIDSLVLQYVNRLGDTLYALARYLETEEKEVVY